MGFMRLSKQILINRRKVWNIKKGKMVFCNNGTGGNLCLEGKDETLVTKIKYCVSLHYLPLNYITIISVWCLRNELDNGVQRFLSTLLALSFSLSFFFLISQLHSFLLLSVSVFSIWIYMAIWCEFVWGICIYYHLLYWISYSQRTAPIEMVWESIDTDGGSLQTLLFATTRSNSRKRMQRYERTHKYGMSNKAG